MKKFEVEPWNIYVSRVLQKRFLAQTDSKALKSGVCGTCIFICYLVNPALALILHFYHKHCDETEELAVNFFSVNATVQNSRKS